MNCPQCGKDMEQGILRAESFIGGVKWLPDRSLESSGPESVAKPSALGYCRLEGFRCAKCRCMVVRY